MMWFRSLLANLLDYSPLPLTDESGDSMTEAEFETPPMEEFRRENQTADEL